MLNKDELYKHIDEIKKLYNVTDAEGELLNQLIRWIQMLAWSPELTLRLLKVLVAMMEAVNDNVKANKK